MERGILSGGYGSFTTPEIKNIAQNIYKITGKPVWLNVGITKDLEAYGDEIAGVTGQWKLQTQSFMIRSVQASLWGI